MGRQRQPLTLDTGKRGSAACARRETRWRTTAAERQAHVSRVRERQSGAAQGRQAAGDRARAVAERNRLGQFTTPTPLARDMVALAVPLLPAGGPVRFLDLAVGHRVLFRGTDGKKVEARDMVLLRLHAPGQRQSIKQHVRFCFPPPAGSRLRPSAARRIGIDVDC
jgi:hypothetical protein